MFRRTSLQSLSLRGCHKHTETGGDTATTNANTGRRSGSGAPPPTVTINTRFSPMTFLPKIDFFKKRRGLRRFVLCNRVTCTTGTPCLQMKDRGKVFGDSSSRSRQGRLNTWRPHQATRSRLRFSTSPFSFALSTPGDIAPLFHSINPTRRIPTYKKTTLTVVNSKR